MKYKVSKYAKMHGVTMRTVWNWIRRGDLKIEKTATGRVLIIEDSAEVQKEKTVAIYTRVSSIENKDNLERQADRMISYCNAKGYKVSKIVKEIGSGLNDKRPKLESLIIDATIDIIVVEHSDRLARFGINYIDKLLKMQGRNIEIVNPVTNEKEDLVQDFVSIITSFTARLYGQRRTKRNTEKLIKSLESEQCN
jgi:predicted site-specific integrase-resolvase